MQAPSPSRGAGIAKRATKRRARGGRRIYTTIHSRPENRHLGWDRDRPPILEVDPGAVVTLDVLDGGGAQVTRHSGTADLLKLDRGRTNPLTGPIFVKGAHPGDALVITFLEFRPKDWAWTAIVPGSGLLADHIPGPYLKIWDLFPKDPWAWFAPTVRLPVRPFVGTIGVALAEAGVHSVRPPRQNGGNMDVRHLTLGSRLFLPVWVPGALLSLGDTHVAQGDGEVCGTAIEAPMEVTLRVELDKNAGLTAPAYEVLGPLAAEAGPYLVTTGTGPDLFVSAQGACLRMIDRVTRRHGLSPEEAYALLSVAADLRISSAPSPTRAQVSCSLPLSIFV